uniref:Uncharacterized protein LOC102803520 n=1 Tax=Saccoglossus kowalevskii TaxID=10224 RepID=A0ABM0MV21_SACKO|nr:PREDICTED: uncharacterized protein LOC102803520 [Saccoglossus kowalevskii]
MEALSRPAQTEGLSERAANILAGAKRCSTNVAYDSKWRAYIDWCSGREVDPCNPTVGQVDDFFRPSISRGACEGTLACSTCHLLFQKEVFDKLPDEPTDEELDMLDLAYGLTDR